ncbi:MAG: CHAP domain-containing protein [Flavobacteriaceae bacterium]|nr:CHAP domain-containing protein [Flavobacteriaceae bacterium]
MTNRQKVIDTATAEIGKGEVPLNSNKTKYGAWYGIGLNGQPWCAIFVSWVFDKAGIPLCKVDSAKGYHYCPSAYNFWKKNKQLTTTPQSGDIALFDWGKDGKSDHTGIFVKDNGDGKTFTAIEGNTAIGNDSNGGTVMQRSRHYSMVLAFVSPICYGQPTIVIQQGAITTMMLLKKGSVGREVVNLQKALNLKGTIPVTEDGFFGDKTTVALKNYQTSQGLVADGVAGAKTYKALGLI